MQTVSFTHLAQGLSGNAKFESKLRRIQRFFAGFVLDNDIIARIIFKLLPEKPPYRLCLDRTNWKFGKTNINILMLSIAYKGVSFPILWSMLPKKGNSNTKERVKLMKRYIRLFGFSTIKCLLADREFIGDDWFAKLTDNGIPFFIRIKENQTVVYKNKYRRVRSIFKSKFYGRSKHLSETCALRSLDVYLSGMRFINRDGRPEYAIVASMEKNPNALEFYKDRWQIETMFRAFKTSGFNIEDTHLSDLDRISKLISVLALAFYWAYLTGILLDLKIRKIKIKKHGRKAYSYFKYGLTYLANALLNLILPDIAVASKVLSCT